MKKGNAHHSQKDYSPTRNAKWLYLSIISLILAIFGLVHQKFFTSGGWFDWEQFSHHESLITIALVVSITLLVVYFANGARAKERRKQNEQTQNPYPKFLIDEASGIKVLDIRNQIWAEGYKAGKDVGSKMSKPQNPYPEFLIDEASGIKVPDLRHQIWAEGYQAGKENRQVIKSVIKAQNGMVVVFDESGEHIPEYQGQYEEVKERILEDAPLNAVFGYFPDYEAELEIVPREEW